MTTELRVSKRVLAREASREALITAASELMVERDGLDFSISDIAARANMSGALIQYHFGSKDGLLLAVVEAYAANAARELAMLSAADYPAARKLRLHVGGVVKTYVRAPFTNRLLQYLIQNADENQAKHLSDVFIRPIAEFHKAMLQQGVREGVFREIDPMHFYNVLIGACEHLTAYKGSLSHVFGPRLADEHLHTSYVDTVYSILMNGMAAQAAQR